MGNRILSLLVAAGVGVTCGFSAAAEKPQDRLEEIIREYEEYQAAFAALEKTKDIEENGFYVIEDQSFPVALESFSEEETEEVFFIPVMYGENSRLGVLIADGRGRVLYKTDQLASNYQWMGSVKQPTVGVAAVSFQDLDRDGLKDIILITDCVNEEGEYAGKHYKVGDVLFQRDGSFYRDWRISDKINRFSMNKSIDFVTAYVRDGISTEILYTASTLEELLDNDFQVFQEQSYYRSFEKQGRLRIVPGIIKMAEYNIFMIYLVNREGNIEWSFQPMGDYDNLYAMKGMACKDLDGDGMKDILVLGRYSYSGPEGKLLIDTRCSIYYQRTDGFAEDKEFKDYHTCTGEDTVSGLVKLIREYWGWTVEND